MKITHLASLALALSLAACDPVNSTLPANIFPPAGDVLSRQHLGPWSYTGFDNARRQLITDSASLEATWAALYRGQDPRPPAPTLDFAKDEIVLVAMGNRSSGGYAIVLGRVTENATDRYIEVWEVSPGTNCAVTTALTSPADAVVLPASAGLAVHFVEMRETRDCI